MEISLETATKLLVASVAEQAATRAALSAIIASHPRPDVLRKLWTQSKPEWIDERAAGPEFQIPGYREAYLRVLGGLTTEIEEAELLTRP